MSPVALAVLFGFLGVSLCFGSDNQIEIDAHVCISGIDQTSQNRCLVEITERKVNEEFGEKEFPNGMRYRYKCHLMDSMEDSLQMREKHLKQANEGEKWSPVFICDLSDDTIFDRLKINEQSFDNDQLHMRRVLNNGDETGHVFWEAPRHWHEVLTQKYPRISFDFQFDEWDSSVTAQEVIDQFQHTLKDSSGNDKWEYHTGKDILKALKSHSQYFGANSEGDRVMFNEDVDQAFLSNDLALSKSFYAFHKEKQSGVIFIGEVHNNDRFTEMEFSIIQSMRLWLDTVFTEAATLTLSYGKSENHLLRQIEELSEEPLFSVCPLKDTIQCLFRATRKKNLPNLFRASRIFRAMRLKGLSSVEGLGKEQAMSNWIAKMDFNDAKKLKSHLWEHQYGCLSYQMTSTFLIRSMLMMNSLDQALQPGTLNVVIQGGSHTLDNLLAMQGKLKGDLLQDPDNIPTNEQLIDFQRA